MGYIGFEYLDSWRARPLKGEPFSSNLYLTDVIEFDPTRLYKDKSFLNQKYLVEGLSIAQIAAQIFSSKDAVRRGLIRHGIPIREAHKSHGRSAQVPFGQKRQQGRGVPHLGERRVIDAALGLRAQGLSLRQIARFLSQIGVPTKCRGKSWHPEMVERILERASVAIDSRKPSPYCGRFEQ